jgi:hypothetical protein
MRNDLKLITLVVLILTGSGCGGSTVVEMTTTPIDAAVPTVTSTPIPTNTPGTTNTPSPTSTPRPTNTPQTTAEGRISGVLIEQSTQQGIQGIELCLIPNNPETGEFGVPLMPSVINLAICSSSKSSRARPLTWVKLKWATRIEGQLSQPEMRLDRPSIAPAEVDNSIELLHDEFGVEFADRYSRLRSIGA